MNQIEDSLDKLPTRNQDQAKLRIAFKRALDKLLQLDTCERGMNEVQRLIKQNREAHHLGIFLTCIKEIRPTDDSTSKEHEVIALAMLIDEFKQRFTDHSMCLQILLRYFKDSRPSVQQACARVCVQLDRHCLRGLPNSKRKQTLIQVLCGVVLNSDKASQAAAAYCLYELLLVLKSQSPDFHADCAKELCILFCKAGYLHHLVTQSLTIYVQQQKLNLLQEKVSSVLKALNVILRYEVAKALQSLSAYMSKIAACQLAAALAKHLQPLKAELKSQCQKIYLSLLNLSKHRIVQLQKAALRAFGEWVRLFSEDQKQELEELKYQQPASQSPGSRRKISLAERRLQRRKENSQERQRRLKDLDAMNQKLQDLVKGKGWGAHSRGLNYVRRGSGSGGGNVNEGYSLDVKQKNLSYISQSKELKQMVMKDRRKGSRDNKFEQLNEKVIQQKRRTEKQGGHQEQGYHLQNHQGDRAMMPSRPIYINNPNKPPAKVVQETEAQGSRGVQKYAKHNLKEFKSHLQDLIKEQEIHQKFARNDLQGFKSQLDSIMKEEENKEANNDNKQEIAEVEQSEFKMEQGAGDRALPVSQRTSRTGRIPLNPNQLSKMMEEHQLSQVSSNVSGLVSGEQYVSFSSNNNEELFKKARQKIAPPKQYEPTKPEVKNKEIKSSPADVYSPIKQVVNSKSLHPLKQQTMPESQLLKEQNYRREKKPTVEQQIKKAPAANEEASKFYLESLQALVRSGEKQDSSRNKAESRKGSRKSESQLAYSKSQSGGGRFDNLREAKSEDPEVEEEIFQSMQMDIVKPTRHQQRRFEYEKQPQLNKDDDKFRQAVREQVNSVLQGLRNDISHMKNYVARLSQPTVIQTAPPPNKLEEKVSRAVQQLKQQFEQLKKCVVEQAEIKQAKTAESFRKQDQQQKQIKTAAQFRKAEAEHRAKQITIEQYEQAEPFTRKLPRQTRDGKSKFKSVDKAWQEAVRLAKIGRLNDSYNIIMDTEDQLYLVRLLLLYGPPAKHLTPTTLRRFTSCFMQIYKSNFLDLMTVSLFGEAVRIDPGLVESSLSLEQLRALLKRLYDLSAGSDKALSFRAACLYNSLHSAVVDQQR